MLALLIEHFTLVILFLLIASIIGLSKFNSGKPLLVRSRVLRVRQ